MKRAIWMSLLLSLNSWAADIATNEWDKRFRLTGGVIAYDMSGNFSSTKEGRPRVELDLDDLDLQDDEVTYFLAANVRIGERWRLRADYYQYSDNGARITDRDYEYNGVIIKAGEGINSSLNFDLYVVNLSYDFYKSERANFGLGIGVHVVDFSLNVTNTVTADEEKDDLTAPLPNLYAGGAYAFKNDFIFRYSLGWMSMSYGDYDGDLVYAQGSLEFWPHKNIGLGAGYAYRTFDVTYKTNSKKETYDIDIPGPILYLTAGF